MRKKFADVFDDVMDVLASGVIGDAAAGCRVRDALDV